MATISLPASFDTATVTAGYRNASALSESPYNFTQQVFTWNGRQKFVEISVPPLSQTDGDDWTEFFDDLNGFENTFNLDLSSYFPHEAGITSVSMMLSEPVNTWAISKEMHYGFSFRAMEAL
jgi:hypothetical protein